MNQKFYRKTLRMLGSDKFFWILVFVFAFQAVWIAVTARYPQAFDEQFHFGIIQIYSHHLMPILSSNDNGSGQFSVVSRDPSFLYQYLMSFPLRFIRLFTTDLTIQVIILRLINVFLFCCGLAVFKRVLARAPISKSLVNVILLFFVFLPVTPLLAAQINYDNVIFPASGLVIWGCIAFVRSIRQSQKIRLDILLSVLIGCLLAGLAKYAFFAIFAGVLVVLIAELARFYRNDKPKFIAALSESFAKLSRLAIVAYVVLAVISGGLFIQRDVVNLTRYHAIAPSCNQALTINQCESYGPWARDYSNHSHNPPLLFINKYLFIGPWIHQNIKELTFTISSHFANDGHTVSYASAQPLPISNFVVWSIFVGGVLLVIGYAKRLWQDLTLRIFMIISGIYLAILFADNYHSNLYARQPVAIHGRYLFPVLLLILTLMTVACSWFLRDNKIMQKLKNPYKLAILTIAFLALLQGGGFVTFITRSNSSWFWQQNSAVQTVNAKAQNVLKYLVVGA